MSGTSSFLGTGDPSVLPDAPVIDRVAVDSETSLTVSIVLNFVGKTFANTTDIQEYEVEFKKDSDGSIVTATSSTSPITQTGLTQDAAYSIRARVKSAYGYGNYSEPVSQTPRVIGESVITTTGASTFTVPAGVTSISVVCIGAGGGGTQGVGSGSGHGGAGGALAYKNNISVTPGDVLNVSVGVGGSNGGSGSATYFQNSSSTTVCQANGGGGAGGSGGTFGTGDGGGNGGNGGLGYGGQGGGGGAGGYSGNGGNGAAAGADGGAGEGGGGGGGGSATSTGSNSLGGYGGGVNVYGRYNNGTGGIHNGSTNGGSNCGTGAASGSMGSNTGSGLSKYAQYYGGGSPCYYGTGGTGYQGAIRVVWPGDERQFPSTDVGYNWDGWIGWNGSYNG